jgi:hypothetical protein
MDLLALLGIALHKRESYYFVSPFLFMPDINSEITELVTLQKGYSCYKVSFSTTINARILRQYFGTLKIIKLCFGFEISADLFQLNLATLRLCAFSLSC